MLLSVLLLLLLLFCSSRHGYNSTLSAEVVFTIEQSLGNVTNMLEQLAMDMFSVRKHLLQFAYSNLVTGRFHASGVQCRENQQGKEVRGGVFWGWGGVGRGRE
jgi:hypothetical protein